MSKDETEIIEAEACTIIDESFVKQARELLDREERSEMAKMLKIILDHYEKSSGEVIIQGVQDQNLPKEIGITKKLCTSDP